MTTDQLPVAPMQLAIPSGDAILTGPVAPALVICDICQAKQVPPADEHALWRCKDCGQQYRGGAGDLLPAIQLDERQVAALRNHLGRDASGRRTIQTNWWTENDQPTGKDFLTWNKDMPARLHIRKMILEWAAAGKVRSILEVAFGGLHEYRALREPLKQFDVTYSGVDWTPHFVAHAQREFPENRWTQGDVVRGLNVEQADLVYSQHMLEHVPALEPAFSNMLRLAKRMLINIFFIPPKNFDCFEVTNWKKYPLYHNTYSVGHVEHVCKAMGFKPTWVNFGEDVVLLAERA
jgi:SAM-dependent methyltransferase